MTRHGRAVNAPLETRLSEEPDEALALVDMHGISCRLVLVLQLLITIL